MLLKWISYAKFYQSIKLSITASYNMDVHIMCISYGFPLVLNWKKWVKIYKISQNLPHTHFHITRLNACNFLVDLFYQDMNRNQTSQAIPNTYSPWSTIVEEQGKLRFLGFWGVNIPFLAKKDKKILRN